VESSRARHERERESKRRNCLESPAAAAVDDVSSSGVLDLG